jgi:catechol 2,3-dioxygenase-like lactoylglutathione lyase family enzyme
LFNFSGTRLLLEPEGPVSSIYFWVDDVGQACASLREKGVTVADPEVIFEDPEGIFGTAGEAEIMAFFEDPSGNTLAFASRR